MEDKHYDPAVEYYEKMIERMGRHAEAAQVSMSFVRNLCGEFEKNNRIQPEHYAKWDVKRGLRNADGTGVVAGVTKIGNVQGYYIQDGERVAMPGKLIYRGIDVEELIAGFTKENRFGFEETAYLLLFGALPTVQQLSEFLDILQYYRNLPQHFTEDMILKAPSADLMNKLGRSILALYSYDPDPDNNSLAVEMQQALRLVAQVPVIVAYAFSAKRHYFNHESLYLHRPQKGLSMAENFLYTVRPDNQYTQEEAKLLDLCLVLHAEHGGGNNSAFACRVLSSSGTDIYSAIAAAVGSLKGPKHGGANKKVMEMFGHIKREVKNWDDDEEIKAFLAKLLRKEAGDRSGLIYGMGHAVYTVSDPRAVLLKQFARTVAEQKGCTAEFNLLESVERLTPEVFLAVKNDNKPICGNVDMYSGLVYQMMDIPEELYTPLFAIARTVGWCAHRIEEIQNSSKIIRPAYKVVAPSRPFVPLEERE